MKRVRRLRLPEPKTIIEEAAIAACKALNRQECPCARAPSVCEAMILAVRAVIRAIEPLAETLAKLDAAEAAAKRR